MHVNLRSLQSLVTIAEHGSFQAAAARLGIGQSAISMQMRGLEQELGVALFDRAQRPPRLTAQGEQVLREARLLLAAESRLRAVALADEGPAGTLYLGVIPTVSVGLLPDALKTLKRLHPAIGIKVESGLSEELTTRLRQGILDAAIVTEPARPDPAFAARLLLDEPLVLIDSRGAETPLTPTLLLARPFIRFNRKAGVGQVIDRLLAALGLAVETAMELDSIDAITRMVALDLGMAIVPRSSIQPHHRRHLRLARIDHPMARRRVVLLSRHDAPEQALIQPLLATLTA